MAKLVLYFGHGVYSHKKLSFMRLLFLQGNRRDDLPILIDSAISGTLLVNSHSLLYIPKTTMAATSTVDGDLALWDIALDNPFNGGKVTDKRITKVLRCI